MVETLVERADFEKSETAATLSRELYVEVTILNAIKQFSRAIGMSDRVRQICEESLLDCVYDHNSSVDDQLSSLLLLL